MSRSKSLDTEVLTVVVQKATIILIPKITCKATHVKWAGTKTFRTRHVTKVDSWMPYGHLNLKKSKQSVKTLGLKLTKGLRMHMAKCAEMEAC